MKGMRDHLFALLLYSIAAIILTYPVVLNLASHVAGSGGDPLQTLWRFEEKERLLHQAFKQGTSTDFIVEEFFGSSQPQLVNLSVWPWMPLHLIFGQPIAYNIIWLMSFILSGFGMYLLVHELLKMTIIKPHSWHFYIHKGRVEVHFGAFIAGMYYMFLPFHTAHALGHFGALQTQWIPLIIACVISIMRNPSIVKSIALFLLLVIQAWSEHHYLLFLSLFTCITFVYYRREVGVVLRSIAVRFSLIIPIVIAAIVIGMSYLPTFFLAAQGSALELGREQLLRFSADLFSFVMPSPFHPVWGSLATWVVTDVFPGNMAESTHTLGIVGLLLIAFFNQFIPKPFKKFWLFIVFFFVLIALGPELHVLGLRTSIPLPFDLVDNLPVINAVRSISRASIFVGLGCAVLVGAVVASHVRRRNIATVLTALIGFEFLMVPVSMQSAEIGPVYDVVRQIPGSRMIEIPAATNYVVASKALYASSYHGKEVIGNIALERGTSAEAYRMIKSLPAVRQLLYLRTTDLVENREEFFGQNLAETLPDVLVQFDINAIIVHIDSLSAYQAAAIDSLLSEQMKYDKQVFDDIVLYRTSYKTGSEHHPDGIFLVRGDGWEHVGYDPARSSVFAEISSHAEVTFFNTTAVSKNITVTFQIAAESLGMGTVSFEENRLGVIREGSDDILFHMVLNPGQSVMSFDIETQDKIILQNPVLRVASQ